MPDEFSHDVLVPLGPSGEWAALGVTRFGVVTAVAVWPFKPTADELLARRLQSGWKPTPTRLQEGERILGHAACVATSCLPSRPAACPVDATE